MRRSWILTTYKYTPSLLVIPLVSNICHAEFALPWCEQLQKLISRYLTDHIPRRRFPSSIFQSLTLVHEILSPFAIHLNSL
ncbi:hypothetical protein F5Y18DRAFT_409899 [Xylariaceae sp. FL1019]|nr:hypothetical protein F5Y18DRAFT_409899 [Xylariaceae sp. FL1019]